VGAAAAWRPANRLVRGMHAALTAGYALPEFLLAIGALWLLAFQWRWFPVGGVEDPLVALTGSPWAQVVDRVRHLALPALTLAVGWAAAFARQQHAAVAGLVHAPAVQVARAKGVSDAGLFARHLLRPTLATPLRLVGVLAPTLAGGALVVESVFGWPGMGTLLVRAIQARDYSTASGAMMALGCAVSVIILLTETLEPIADPRRRHVVNGGT
jgi:peptide/nickel transport system permease protein